MAQSAQAELLKQKSQLEKELKESQAVFSLTEAEKTTYSSALETLTPKLDALCEKSLRGGLSGAEYMQFGSMYQQYEEAYNALANEYRNPNWGKVLHGTLEQGAGYVVGGVTSFADMALGGFAQEIWTLAGQTIGKDLGTNPISALNNFVQNTRAADAAYYAEAAGDSRAAQNLNKYGTIVAAAAPMMLMALMTNGGSLAGTASTESLAMTAAMEQSAGLTQVSLYANQALQTLVKDPNAQFSFAQEAGSAYQEALNDGADTGSAAIYATIYGLWAALVEMGGSSEALGGMQALPVQVRQALERGDRDLVFRYACSIAGEVGEENIQGALENGFKFLYGKEVPVFSMEDENAIVNPQRMKEESKGAAIASAVLGGGQVTAQVGINQRQGLQSGQWNVPDTQMPGTAEESTSVNDDPQTHTKKEMANIEAYKASVDEDLKEVFEEYYSNPQKGFSRYNISSVTEKQAADIANVIGGNYVGYRNAINASGIKHILNEHGPEGTVNRSMSDLNDAARIGYILENYDSMELATYASGEPRFSEEFRDSQNRPAPMVVFRKKVNGTYYVVEAVPDTKYKKLWVVSAYLDKKGGITQAPNAQGPGNTSDTSLASLPPNSIPNQNGKVNDNLNSKPGANTPPNAKALSANQQPLNSLTQIQSNSIIKPYLDAYNNYLNSTRSGTQENRKPPAYKRLSSRQKAQVTEAVSAALDQTNVGELFNLYWDYEKRSAIAEKLYSDYAEGPGVFGKWEGKLGDARALAAQFDRIAASGPVQRLSLEERPGETGQNNKTAEPVSKAGLEQENGSNSELTKQKQALRPLDVSKAKQNVDDYVNDKKSFDQVVDDYAVLYAEKVLSNKVWKWRKIRGGGGLSYKQRKEIRESAFDTNLLPKVPMKQGTDYPDFLAAGLVYEINGKPAILSLPENMWHSRDRVQFAWLDKALLAQTGQSRPDG